MRKTRPYGDCAADEVDRRQLLVRKSLVQRSCGDRKNILILVMNFFLRFLSLQVLTTEDEKYPILIRWNCDQLFAPNSAHFLRDCASRSRTHKLP
jgi:hypothetical protein